MLVELTPLLPKLTEFAMEVLPPLTDAAVKLADPLQKLLDLFAAIFDWVDKLVGPLIKVTDALNSVTDNAITRTLLSTLGPFGATAGALMDSGGGGGSGDYRRWRVRGGGALRRRSWTRFHPDPGMPGEHMLTTDDVNAMVGKLRSTDSACPAHG